MKWPKWLYINGYSKVSTKIMVIYGKTTTKLLVTMEKTTMVTMEN